jgi:phosphinothricin acetyltransferase
MTAADWPQVAAIYAAGIRTGHATFEPEVPAWEDWDARHVPGLRLVAVGGTPASTGAPDHAPGHAPDHAPDHAPAPGAPRLGSSPGTASAAPPRGPTGRLPADRVLGWAALAPVSDRRVYAGVGEHSLYVAEDARGRGVGRAVLTALLAGSETAGFWTVQTHVFPENTASVALHVALGFRTVGIRERLGRMPVGPLAGRWRDVVLLERRSAVAGRDG